MPLDLSSLRCVECGQPLRTLPANVSYLDTDGQLRFIPIAGALGLGFVHPACSHAIARRLRLEREHQRQKGDRI